MSMLAIVFANPCNNIIKLRMGEKHHKIRIVRGMTEIHWNDLNVIGVNVSRGFLEGDPYGEKRAIRGPSGIDGKCFRRSFHRLRYSYNPYTSSIIKSTRMLHSSSGTSTSRFVMELNR